MNLHKMFKERVVITACAFVMLLALAAVSPRPARPAVPSQPVSAGTLSGVVICVDAGHGGADGGARARESLKWEREINLEVALKVRDALERMGATVIMTREDENCYAAGKREDLTARLEKAREGGAQMLLSIHMNEYTSRRESGPQVFYRAGQEKSRLLAGVMQQSLIDTLQPAKQRAALSGDYFILSGEMPAVLVECGFLSNAEEEKLLLDEGYQQRIGQAVADGAAAFIRLQQGLDQP